MSFKKVDPKVHRASHALLISGDARLYLQKKTADAPLNPGKISMFGGGLETGEDEQGGLERELREELGLELREHRYKKLADYPKTIEVDGSEALLHVYCVSGVDREKLILMEGEDIVSGLPSEILNRPDVTRITRLAVEAFLKQERN